MSVSIAGITISLVGTIMLAFSIRKGKVYMWKDSSKKREYAAVFAPRLFYSGIALLALGFILQILGASQH